MKPPRPHGLSQFLYFLLLSVSTKKPGKLVSSTFLGLFEPEGAQDFALHLLLAQSDSYLSQDKNKLLASTFNIVQ